MDTHPAAHTTESLATRIQQEFNGAMSVYLLLLGHRLGLLDALHRHGPSTADELAAMAGCDRRYVREWLAAMAAGGYVAYDTLSARARLTPEQAAVLVDADSGYCVAPMLHWAPRLAAVLPALEEAFRTGGGVPYDAYQSGEEDAAGDGNRVEFLRAARGWLYATPDIAAQSQAARALLDVGCGHGWSSIALAVALPHAAVVAVDADAHSIRMAQRNAAQAGLAGRITFQQSVAEEFDTPQRFDVITAFECVHDMAQPVRVLQRLRSLLAPGGIVLIADELMGDDLADNLTPNGHYNYNWSVLHCLPQARVDPDSAATGCAMGPGLLRRYAESAGFSVCEILPIEHPVWRFYLLKG